MSLQPFDGPKLKIERAKAHIRDLKRHSDVFLERKPYSLLVEPDDETRQRRVIFRIQEEVPAEIPLIIGDAIHNLRSSLDIMICDVLALVGDPSRRGRFPFADSADGLETVMKKKIKRAPDDIKQMTRSLKPYKGSGGPLRGLHDLDIGGFTGEAQPVKRSGSARPCQAP